MNLIINENNKRSKILLINLFIFISFSLYLSTFNIVHQDRWILDGIFPQFMFVTILFFFSVMYLSDIQHIALLCSIFIVLLNLIPGLKYGYFLDTGDSTTHYMLAKHLLDYGYPIENSAYSAVPGFHIFLITFTLLSNNSLNFAFKYLLPMSSVFYPLIIYTIINRFETSYNVKKYTIISSILIVINYVINGPTFGSIILFLIFSLFFIRKDSSSIVILILISVFSLIISHGVTSFLLPIFLLGPICFFLITKLITNFKISSPVFNRSIKFYLIILVFLFSWFMFQSDYLFNIFIRNIYEQIFLSTPPLKALIPQKFFEVGMLSKIRISLICHSRDLILILNSLIGCLVFFKYRFRKKGEQIKNFYDYVYFVSVLTVIFILLLYSIVSNFGDLEYTRYIYYGLLFSPFFMGISIAYYEKTLSQYFKKFISKLILFTILLSIFYISLIQFYPYQPLVPTANSLNINSNDPIVNFHNINTEYRINAIKYTEGHISENTFLCTDISTKKQIQAFATKSLYDKVGYTLSMSEPLSRSHILFLLHDIGFSGVYVEPVENRTRSRIDNLKTSYNMVYSNGGFFLLER